MIPASILAKGDRVALEYLLESSPLGAFFEREEVRRAIAEDILLEQFKPFVFTALFIDEEPILASWRAQRPDAYTLAKKLAEEALKPFESLSKEHYRRRFDLRLSTYRKIDVWWCGSELFVPHEALGAEPYFTITLPGYEASPVKIGQTRSFNYASDPKRDAVALDLLLKKEIVDSIERARYPLLPQEGPQMVEEWSDLQAVLGVAETFRAFDRQNKLPAFPKTLIVDPVLVPGGFRARFASDAALWSSLYAMGISPILSDPAAEYLKTKTRSVSALMSERNTLLDFLCRSIRFEGKKDSET